MGIKSISVVLMNSNQSSTFYTGSNVNGRIIIYIEKTSLVKCLELKMKGKAIVYWSETRHESRHQRNMHHRNSSTHTERRSSKEIYFSTIVPLMVDTVLHVGTREIDFVFNIPGNLPSTYHSEHGRIRYTAKATLNTDKQLLWRGHHTSKVEYIVVNPVDLNALYHARAGISRFIKHNFYNIVISAGDFKMTAMLRHCGFAPGHPMLVDIEGENESNIEVHGLLFIVKEEVTYRTKGPYVHTHTSHRELVRQHAEGIMCNTAYSRNCVVHIPSTVHGDISPCTIITCNYYLLIEAEVHGLHVNPSMNLGPLYIGSIPVGSRDLQRESYPSGPSSYPAQPAYAPQYQTGPMIPPCGIPAGPVSMVTPASGYPMGQPPPTAMNPSVPARPAMIPPTGIPQVSMQTPPTGYPQGPVPPTVMNPSEPARPGVIPGQPGLYPKLPTQGYNVGQPSAPSSQPSMAYPPPYPGPPSGFTHPAPPPPYGSFSPSAPQEDPYMQMKKS